MNALPSRADIKVLALVGNPTGTVHRQLLRLPVQMAAAGIKLMIGELRCMPIYREDIDRAEVPEAVAALRVAAAESDAAVVISPMYGTRSPALRNAIDWLTQPGSCELHDKPLAVVGGAMGAFVGVWSHPTDRSTSHVIEKIAFDDLGEMVHRLAAQISRAPTVFEAGRSAAS